MGEDEGSTSLQLTCIMHAHQSYYYLISQLPCKIDWQLNEYEDETPDRWQGKYEASIIQSDGHEVILGAGLGITGVKQSSIYQVVYYTIIHANSTYRPTRTMHHAFAFIPRLYRLGMPRPLPLSALCAAPGGKPRCGA
jgi:hypothetical protein